MANNIRIALPGYDAINDTNLDHFALFTNEGDDNQEDNVLIKEKERGSFSLTVGVGEQVITHNLGYVPFFLVYVLDVDTGKWMLVPNAQSTGSVPPYLAVADTSVIRVFNFYSDTIFKYYIFYDNVVGSSGLQITESDRVVKIPKRGFNALTERDPNNLIFHSDLNTFKIRKEGNADITYTADGAYTIAHGISNFTPTSYLFFLEFPDGFTALIPGKGLAYSKDRAWYAEKVYIDSTLISVTIGRLSGSDTALKAKYYIFETPLT